MSEDNSENLYYYSNKGRQYTFNLDDLTTEELKKFEKMTERQRLKFITNFELQKEAPFQDNVSLKPIMTEARNEKYGDYALFKAKLDEVEKLIDSDKENYSNAENFSIVSKDGKKILPAYLEDFRYITEEDVRNCMKAFDMNQATLEMLKKYYKRKIESIDLPGIKSSFLDSLKKFYKNLIDENNREKFKIQHLEDKYENDIKNLTIDDITEQTTEERIKELQNQLKQLVKSLIKKMDITDKKIIKYVDAFEWEKVQKFAEDINNEELKKLLNEYLEVEDKGTSVISPEMKEKDYEETEKPEVLEKKEDEKIETKEEEEKEEPEETKEETKEEEKIEDSEIKEEPDINTPMKRRETELNKKLEEQIINVMDSLLRRRDLIRNAYEDKKYPEIKGLTSKEVKNDFGSEIKEYFKNGKIFTKIINEQPLFQKIKFHQYTTNKPDYYYEVIYDKENNTTNITLKDSSGNKITEIKYIPIEGKAYYESDRNKATIKYTKYGKGYKIKYTSGSIIDKIRDKFSNKNEIKNINSEINELKNTDKDLKQEDKNIYSKLDSLQKQIEDLKIELKKKNEIPIAPPIPKISEDRKPKPKVNFLDDISNPKPLKPVKPQEKPQEELTDLQKALIDRRKDIEYSEDSEDDDEWGEGYSKKKRRMEILDFLNSLD